MTASRVHGAAFAVVPEWVLLADVSDRAVRLWGILIRHASPEGYAFPGRPRMAELLRCSVPSVDRAFDELVAIGAVRKQPRYREDGSRSSNSYWLWPFETPTTTPQSASPVMTPPITGDAGPPITGDAAVTKASMNDKTPTPLPPVTTSPERVVEGAGEKVTVVANRVTRWVYDNRTPRPVAPFMAARGLAERFLKAGWDEKAVAEAMHRAPTLTTGSIEFALNNRTKPTPAPGRHTPRGPYEHRPDEWEGYDVTFVDVGAEEASCPNR